MNYFNYSLDRHVFRTKVDQARWYFEGVPDPSYRPGLVMCDRWRQLIDANALLPPVLQLHLDFVDFWVEEHPGAHGIFTCLCHCSHWVVCELTRQKSNLLDQSAWVSIADAHVRMFAVFDIHSVASRLAKEWLSLLSTDDQSRRSDLSARVEHDLPRVTGSAHLIGFVQVWADRSGC